MQGVFVAGDGDLSVVHPAGAHVWGAWNVNYSEGVEPEDFEADRSLGYVGDTGDAGDELAARMWIRSDVSIDQDSQSSTLPAVFRDARERMSGDVVVERTISGPGLGGLVPYVDFHHGDEIGTVIGPKVVPLPVNGIEFSTDPDGGQDYEVHVGKGLLGNREERDLRNAQLEAQILKEIAERKREQARLEAQAATDRQQTAQIASAQNTLSYQQSTLSSQQSTQRDMLNALGYAIYASRNISQTMKLFWDGELTQAQARGRMQTYELSAASSIATWEQLQGGN